MVNFSLKEKVLEYYGSRHYLFRVVASNGFDMPVEWEYGDLIKLPPRGSRTSLVDAERRRKTMTYNPLGEQ